ncbi:MAG: YaaC family protein [Candidatus Hodarchaeales archaeon]|jgi:hypothetical protein
MATGNLYRYEYQFLAKLEDLSYPYYLQKRLEDYWVILAKKDPEYIEKEKLHLKEKIKDYYEHDSLEESILDWKDNKPKNIEKIAKPRSLSPGYLERLAKRSASFFRQAKVMYETSLNMNDNSSPLVEYYSLLQCVKGSVLLQLEVNEEILFRSHGITCQFDKTKDKYPKANIKATGVFHSLLLVCDPWDEMNDFFTGKIDLSLDKLLTRIPNSPASAFILSFILSSLVRYHPEYWQTILLGTGDDIIREINNFRREKLPESIDRLFHYYIR